MTSYISHTSVDCRDAYELADWWKAVLGYVDLSDDPNQPGHPECIGTRDQEVDRLLGAGATQVADHRGIYGPGSGWVVLADPEGNELDVLRSDAELSEQDTKPAV
jgi:Glyoxalase-like domain